LSEFSPSILLQKIGGRCCEGCVRMFANDDANRTLQGMFPNLDQEVIVDVVRAEGGHVGRAVDACLALTTT
jgi:hypothetical protein